MPYLNNGTNKVSQRGYISQPETKKKIILIEQTTFLLVVAFLLFKLVAFLWPQDVILPYSLLDFILSLPTLLRTYPAFVGVVLSFITWHTMYFDSALPGMDPPTPLSPAKYRTVSGADYHLNYIFALLIGPLVTTFLYLDWV